MSMHFDLMINLNQIGHFYVQRIDPVCDPSEIDPDQMCVYRVEIQGEFSPTRGINLLYSNTTKHRFGDGAWALIHKALGEYLESKQ